MRIPLFTIAMAALVALAPAASAQAQAFPSKPVTIVVPYPAGGSSDVLARSMAERLSKSWGQPVVVDNRTGANGIIATQTVMRAAPDGHTILLHLTGYIQNASLYRKLPYDPFRDMVPVMQVGTQPMGLAVSPSSPYNSVGALAEALRNRSERFSYGSFGAGSTGHIFGELLKSNTHANMPHVPYRGESPMLPDLMTGQLSVAFVSAATAVSRQKDKSLRILAVTGPRRFEELPNVPTLGEAGLKGFDLVGWYGLFLPKDTPRGLTDKIAADVRVVLAQPQMKEKMRELAIQPTGTTSAEFTKLLRSDYERWDSLIKQFGIALE